MSTLRANSIVNAAGNNTAQINGMTPTAQSLQGFRNRIINGDMRIDQRNSGAAITGVTTATGRVFPVDRNALSNQTDGVCTTQQTTTVPAGFNNSLYVTVTTADASIGATQYCAIEQRVEGFNVADLGWGTANAQAVTISFWVRSSITGTYCVSIYNSGGARSYVATYTVSAANTWEQKTITIAGDTSGTWLTNNGIGIILNFCLGVGSTYQQAAGAWGSTAFAIGSSAQTQWISTLGATFYITGVQLEAGSVATPFERRPYGAELMLCQRYYSKTYDTNTAVGTNTSYGQTTTSMQTVTSSGLCQTMKFPFPVVMRSSPTINLWTYTGTAGSWHAGVAGQSETAYSASASSTFASTTGVVVSMSGVNITYNVAYGHWAASAEL